MRNLLIVGLTDCEYQGEYDRVVATLFVNDKKENPNFIKKLKFKEHQNASVSDIKFKADQIVITHGYGFPKGYFSRKDEVDVIGKDILATCFDLWDDGINFNILWDHVEDSVGLDDLRTICKKYFGLK